MCSPPFRSTATAEPSSSEPPLYRADCRKRASFFRLVTAPWCCRQGQFFRPRLRTHGLALLMISEPLGAARLPPLTRYHAARNRGAYTCASEHSKPPRPSLVFIHPTISAAVGSSRSSLGQLKRPARVKAAGLLNERHYQAALRRPLDRRPPRSPPPSSSSPASASGMMAFCVTSVSLRSVCFSSSRVSERRLATSSSPRASASATSVPYAAIS